MEVDLLVGLHLQLHLLLAHGLGLVARPNDLLVVVDVSQRLLFDDQARRHIAAAGLFHQGLLVDGETRRLLKVWRVLDGVLADTNLVVAWQGSRAAQLLCAGVPAL